MTPRQILEDLRDMMVELGSNSVGPYFVDQSLLKSGPVGEHETKPEPEKRVSDPVPATTAFVRIPFLHRDRTLY
jgi:hypothetical protein